MPVNIGPKIGIDGEKEFRQNLNSISQQLKTLGTEMKAVTSAFDANDKSQENLANQSQVLTEQLSLQEKRIAEIQKALDHARSNYAENSNQVQRWQQAMNNAVAELNKTRSQLSKVQSEMDGASDSTQDMSDALNDVDGAAEKASSGISSMTVAMGNLISSGIQAAASAVADLVSSLWNLDESTEEYRRAQGRLNTAFEAAGYGADTAQQAYKAFYGILGDTDTATEASQLLAQLAESEEDVATWTEIAAGVSGTFGDSLPIEGLIEAANETAKVGKVTGTLADALNWVGISEDEFNEKLAACSSESERNQLIMEALSGAYDEASDAFYRNNEVLVQARENQAAMDEATGNLGATISNLKNSLMNDLAPALTGVVNAFNGLLNNEEGAPEQFAASIQALVEQVTAMLPNLISAGTQLLASLVTGIIQALPSLLAAVPEIVGGFVTTLASNFPQILQAGIDVLDQITTGIEQGIPDMLSRIPEIVVQFLNYITEQLPTILDKGVELLNSVVDGILDAIPDMVASLPEVISAFIGFIAESLPNIVQAGIDILLNLQQGILKTIPKLVAHLPRIIEAIVNGIGALLGSIVNIGKNIVQGVWTGIQNMISWFTNKVKSFFSGIVDSVLGFLGIHSPSRVFADIGENMAAGLGVGWDDEFGSIQRQIDRSMSGLVPEVNGNVSVTGGSTASSQATDITAAITSALSGAVVYMDGRKVGKLITKTQNQSIRAAGLVPTI